MTRITCDLKHCDKNAMYRVEFYAKEFHSGDDDMWDAPSVDVCSSDHLEKLVTDIVLLGPDKYFEERAGR